MRPQDPLNRPISYDFGYAPTYFDNVLQSASILRTARDLAGLHLFLQLTFQFDVKKRK